MLCRIGALVGREMRLEPSLAQTLTRRIPLRIISEALPLVFGIALTAAAVPLWTQLSLLEECRGRVERALAALKSMAAPNPATPPHALLATPSQLPAIPDCAKCPQSPPANTKAVLVGPVE